MGEIGFGVNLIYSKLCSNFFLCRVEFINGEYDIPVMDHYLYHQCI